MKKQTITISDLEKFCKHPFSELVGTACRFQSKILLSCGETQINAKSIMGVMAFNLSPGTSIDIIAEGPDEDMAVKAIEAFLLCR